MPNEAGESPLRVAFADIVNPGWTAGAHYYKNLFMALRRLEGDSRPRVVVVVAPHQRDRGYETYRDLADEVVEIPVPRRSNILTRQMRRVTRRLTARNAFDLELERLLRGRGIDAIFACWQEFGPSFPVPSMGWIPDFQHRHLPELFSAAENRQRDALFERMAMNCTRIVLSSEDARRDFERIHPAFAAKARVLRFVAHVPPDVYDDDPARMCAEYHLPERFVYLPNQFWAHKGHSVVVEALGLLKARHPEIAVVCTGNPADNRDPLHFAELLARASRLDVRDRFIVLGWVPHEHIFQLMRQSIAVLQPSLFEGWSTTVEEAKSIGKAVVVSDIPVHREQDPAGAVYFDPTDAAALAERLIEVYATHAPGPDKELEAAARASLPQRAREYALEFVGIVRDAMAG